MGDRKLSAKVKGNMYQSVIEPVMLCGMEIVAMNEKQVVKMEVARVKNGKIGIGCYKKRQHKGRVCDRDG